MSIKRKMAAGAAWMVLARLADRSLGLVSTLILARLLVPADFGIVAMATALVAVFELLTAFSFDTALVSRNDAQQHQYHTAWTLNAVFTAGAGAVVAALAYPASVFYGDERLLPMIAVLGGTMCIQGLENIGIVAFRKEMTFGKEFAFMFGKRLAGFAVTIPLAFATRSYWSLVIGIVATRVTGVVLSYLMHPFRPRVSFREWRSLFSFSSWLLITNLMTFLNTRSTDFIIGKISGPAGVGVYNLGFEISNLPSSELMAPINRAVLPGYVSVAARQDELRRAYVQVLALVSLVTIPAAAGIASLADLLVATLLGPKWTATVPLIQILGFCGAMTSLTSNAYSVFLAIGRPRPPAVMTAGRALCSVPLLLFATKLWGVIGAAWAMFAISAAITPMIYALVTRYIHVRPSAYFACLWRPSLAAGVMAWVLHELNVDHYLASLPDALRLLAFVVTGAAVYAAALLIIWAATGRKDTVERMLLGKLVEQLGRARNAIRSMT